MECNSIGILSPSFGIWGGGQIYIEQICRYFNDKKVPCFIYTAEPEKFACATLSIANINSPLDRLLRVFRIIRRMRHENITHVVLNDLSSAWLAPFFRIAGFKVIALLHLELKISENGAGHGRWGCNIIKWALRFGTHKILSVNTHNLAIAPKKSVFVANYVPRWIFSELKLAKKFDICFVGRFAWQKNIPLLLEILKRSRNVYRRDLELLLIGEGPDAAEISRTIAESGIGDLVTAPGWVERMDLPRFLRSSRCFAITSRHEGFATTLLESHACAVPAFTTDVGYCGTFVEKIGNKTGFIFDPSDLDDPAFFRKLFDLIDNHESYQEECVTKAALFSEDIVLGRIFREITSCGSLI
jgi:glycosyltransferase involved in cell wall biosynthesis